MTKPDYVGDLSDVRVTKGAAVHPKKASLFKRLTCSVQDRFGRRWHTHVDENGFLVKCYHSTRSTILSPSFWLGVTLSFPLEHFIWEKLWPFYLVTELLGL